MTESQLGLLVFIGGFDKLVGYGAARGQFQFESGSRLAECFSVFALNVEVLHLETEFSEQCLSLIIVLNIENEALHFAIAEFEESCRFSEVGFLTVIHLDSHLDHLGICQCPFMCQES